MSNIIKKEKHFIDGLIDNYHSTLNLACIKQEFQEQERTKSVPEASRGHFINASETPKGHFINALSLASSSFMDIHPNARELWPNSHPVPSEGREIFCF